MLHDPSYYTAYESRLGELFLIGSARGLRGITMRRGAEADADILARMLPASALQHCVHAPGFFTQTCATLDDYLEHGGVLKLPYELMEGTLLQRAVWVQLAKIPYGTTVSYSELAERVGFPRAVRAVASACGANPLPLVIPCHRVIAKDGTLGGFSLGGVAIKETLLAIESRAEQRQVA
jgi:AraC family transcriptional regulator, regulatory protein of adaptative response / methylated-DNA-[protein]-cysteine methyltransferase